MDIIMDGPKARRANPTVAIAVVAVAASALFSGYTWYQAHHHPVAVYVDKWATVRSRVIRATVTAFQSQNNLTVKSMSGNVQVQAERGAWFLNGKQKISMPASVLYFIDLKAAKRRTSTTTRTRRCCSSSFRRCRSAP